MLKDYSFILDERRFEFSFEGHRWFGLVWTGRAFAALAPVGMKEYMTVFAIPLNQVKVMIDASIFPQNNGYN